MKIAIAQQIIAQTAKDYDAMVRKFDQTRSHAWADFEYSKPYIKPNATILDYGCGNGRLVDWLKPFQPKSYLGVDISEKFIQIAQNKYFNIPWVDFHGLDGDCVETQHVASLRQNQFDLIFAVAVLHHIPSRQRCQQLLAQFYDWLKPGGYLILTNWNLKQKKFRPYRLKYKLKWLLGQSELDWNDIYFPFKDNDGQLLASRYLHCFTPKEIARACQKTNFQVILNHQAKNIVTIAWKQ